MTEAQEPYLAYLLRIWPVEEHGKETWRASLQCVSSGDRTGFENMEDLIEHLRKRTQGKSERTEE
jgi:hypothetical protein